MKQFLTLIIAISFLSCSNRKVFVLKDANSEKFYLSDSINFRIDAGQLTSSPLIVIDGIPLKYKNELDTVYLPIEKKDVYLLTFLGKKTASVIYGENGKKGVVLISTKPNPE
ncbi:hypothetical protein AB3G34_05010 [Flavobacterium sp. WC2409]|uniref:TonB-dependent receptor plug domain-containing protein n=1 Tax=Flavobacterium sp. WC2409 TaxID=3234139 RepID=A0AB39W4E3_9FLAO